MNCLFGCFWECYTTLYFFNIGTFQCQWFTPYKQGGFEDVSRVVCSQQKLNPKVMEVWFGSDDFPDDKIGWSAIPKGSMYGIFTKYLPTCRWFWDFLAKGCQLPCSQLKRSRNLRLPYCHTQNDASMGLVYLPTSNTFTLRGTKGNRKSSSKVPWERYHKNQPNVGKYTSLMDDIVIYCMG